MDMIHENLQHNLHKKNGVSVWTLVLVIVITFLVAFLVFKNLNNIGNRISWGALEQSTGFTVGQSIALSGTVVQNGDYITYTHTMTLADGTVVGLKSKTIDLGMYSGLVEIQGIVEKLQNTLFIIEVTSASGSSAVSTGVAVNTMTQQGLYIAAAGVYFPYDFGDTYTLKNKGENWEIKIIRASNAQSISVEYFGCTTADSNKNCAQLIKNFSPMAEKTFTDSNGNKFYKLEWVNSWFATNDYFGYFINDIPEQEVKDIVSAIVIVNKSYVSETLVPRMLSLCTDSTVTLQSVSSQTVGKDLNGLYVQLQWATANGTAWCKVVLDPSSSLWGVKLSFTPSSTPGTSTTPSSLDFSVAQFPVNMAKALTYTSTTKWYTIVFPSSNISYAGATLDEDFEISGLKCSSQMNVIKYSDKALLATNPTVKIFECTAKKDITLPSNAFLQTKVADGRIFLIEIMDGAWKDFAQNISIQ